MQPNPQPICEPDMQTNAQTDPGVDTQLHAQSHAEPGAQGAACESTVEPDAPRPRYHHGALRAALLEACGQLLAEHGVAGFSLRECARRAGVSHGAPAHHFGDARGLLTAYAALGFERLAAASRAALDAHASDPARERLVALALAYLGFALRQAAQFRLMFRRELIDPADADLLAAGNASYDLLAATVEALTVAQAPVSAAARRQRLWLAWSSVHGLATLVLDGALAHQGLDPARPDACLAAARPMFDALARGLEQAR